MLGSTGFVRSDIRSYYVIMLYVLYTYARALRISQQHEMERAKKMAQTK